VIYRSKAQTDRQTDRQTDHAIGLSQNVLHTSLVCKKCTSTKKWKLRKSKF